MRRNPERPDGRAGTRRQTTIHQPAARADEWWSLTGSNRRHPACKAGALPAELRPPTPATAGVRLAKPQSPARGRACEASRPRTPISVQIAPRRKAPQGRPAAAPFGANPRAAGRPRWNPNQKPPFHRPAARDDGMVGLGRLELPTSRLSSARSNQLSYKPDAVRPAPPHEPPQRQATPPRGRPPHDIKERETLDGAPGQASRIAGLVDTRPLIQRNARGHPAGKPTTLPEASSLERR